MSDSNITKRALATALKALMEEMPFDKITVSDICEKCEMHRKSFYYHFKDKYDLVNWIFDTEFIRLASNEYDVLSYNKRWDFIEKYCEYFYENRNFYRKALKIQGQNSFIEHLREFIFPVLNSGLQIVFQDDAVDDFTVNFTVDATLCAIERWMMDADCMPPEEFVYRLKRLSERLAAVAYEKKEC